MTDYKKFVLDFLTISRAKLQLASFPHATLGIILGISGLTNLISLSIVTYILLVFTLITFACNINCLCDMDVDGRHKKYMSNAAKSIGSKNIKIILGLELILVFYLMYLIRQHTITLTISLLGLFLAITYSAKPFRIKSRGILSPFPVLIGLYTLTVLGGWFLVNNTFPFHLILFLTGYALMNEGITLVNTCEDFSEDEKEGIRTWAHIFGLKKTLIIAIIFTSLGLLTLISIFIKTITISFLTLVLGLISIFTILSTTKQIYNISKSNNLERSAKKYAPKMGKWFMMTRYPLFLVVLSLMI
jgi:4-hydroxybenzoate polyprenyltransferase